MKTYIFLIASILLILPLSCAVDEMDRTIFIRDERDQNLPAYTEWGYNSFGAKYERVYFLVSEAIVPCKIIYQAGILHFSLIGDAGERNYNDYYEYYRRSDDEKMSVTFSFPSPPMNDFTDLLSLNNTDIQLTDASSEVKIEKNGNESVVTPLSGRLVFKRTQLLRVDEKIDRVILSGTFDMKFLINSKPETLSNGRFDIAINNNDFYSYVQQ